MKHERKADANQCRTEYCISSEEQDGMRAGRMARRVVFALTCLGLATLLIGKLNGMPRTVNADFRQAHEGYRFAFPRDLRPRHGYRTSWWYYTGHLIGSESSASAAADSEKRANLFSRLLNPQSQRYGYQFTIFKIENEANPDGDYRPGHVFYMAHLALSDTAGRKYYFTERLQRHFPGIAGYDEATQTVYVENNTLQIDESGRLHRIRMRAQDFQLDLDLRSELGPRVHGENSISRKGFDPDSATHYISIVDLSGSANLKIGAQPAQKLAAKSWMDIEFGSNVLGQTQTGWDWLHVTLENNERYMVFRVRDSKGQDFYSASYIDPRGRIQPLPRDAIRMLPGRSWKSPRTNATYPVEWQIELTNAARQTTLRLTPWLDDQEAHPEAVDGSRVSYWEGAVDVEATVHRTDGTSKTLRGLGYVEMTGYARSMGGKI